MTLDPHTLLLMSSSTIIVIAGVEVFIWSQDRRDHALLWIVAAGILCCASMLLREILPSRVAIVVANIILTAGASCVATTCRALGNRPPAWSGFALPALSWLAACMVPAFMASQHLRVAASSCTSALIMAWAIIELWRDRRERLRSRLILQILLGIHGLASLIRSGVAALSMGASSPSGLVRASDVPFVTFWVFGLLLLVNLGVILFVKERSEARLRLVADADPLTGLANRRRFQQALDVAVSQARHSRRPVAVLMVDADAFKLYNDRYGHLLGDQALQDVAGVLADVATGANGLAARYGGEEFTVLLPDADDAEALRLAEAMRDGVHRLAIVHDDWHHGRLTISIGLTSRIPTDGVGARDYLLAADQALYAAKRAGRHRIQSWQDNNGASTADRVPDGSAQPPCAEPA